MRGLPKGAAWLPCLALVASSLVTRVEPASATVRYSLSQQREAFVSFTKSVQSDVNECEVGVYDSQVALQSFLKDRTSKKAAGMLYAVARDASLLCSPRDPGIASLPNKVPPALASQKNLNLAFQTLGVWAVIEAVPGMQDLELYAEGPLDQKAFNTFKGVASTMNSYKVAIDTTFAAAAKRLGVEHFEGLEVPELMWWAQ